MNSDDKIKDLTVGELILLIRKTVYEAVYLYIEENGVSSKQKKQIEAKRKKDFIKDVVSSYVVNLCEGVAQRYEGNLNLPQKKKLRDFQDDLESYFKDCGFRTENSKNGIVVNGIPINIQILTRIIQEKYGKDAIVRIFDSKSQTTITYIDRKVLLSALRAKRKTEKEILERELAEKTEAQKAPHPDPTQAPN